MRRLPTRRSFVLAAGGVAGALAGCLNPSGGDGSGDESGDDGGGSSNGAGTGTEDAGSTTTEETRSGTGGGDGSETNTELDLREANVTGVELESQGDGRVRFSVTLYHDDDGEDGYANWWVVEALDGTELGRRELAHPHGNEPFTRSATVETGERACVVVRGHDETHGYGGEAALVDLDSGQVRFVRQGPDRRSFDASDCP